MGSSTFCPQLCFLHPTSSALSSEKKGAPAYARFSIAKAAFAASVANLKARNFHSNILFGTSRSLRPSLLFAGLKEGALASAGSSIAKIAFAKGAARAMGPRVSQGFGYFGTAAAIAAAVGGSVYNSMGERPAQQGLFF